MILKNLQSGFWRTRKKMAKIYYYLCNVKKPKKHCKTKCFCGRPHQIIRDRDGGCSQIQFCDIVKQKVHCTKLSETELKIWEKKRGWQRKKEG